MFIILRYQLIFFYKLGPLKIVEWFWKIIVKINNLRHAPLHEIIASIDAPFKQHSKQLKFISSERQLYSYIGLWGTKKGKYIYRLYQLRWVDLPPWAIGLRTQPCTAYDLSNLWSLLCRSRESWRDQNETDVIDQNILNILYAGYNTLNWLKFCLSWDYESCSTSGKETWFSRQTACWINQDFRRFIALNVAVIEARSNLTQATRSTATLGTKLQLGKRKRASKHKKFGRGDYPKRRLLRWKVTEDAFSHYTLEWLERFLFIG